MIELIVAHPHAFWLSLGGLLLAAEMLGGNGYLLWSGVAAVITGLLVWILPLDWAWQGALFAALTLVAAWLWWRWLNRQVNGVFLGVGGHAVTLCKVDRWWRAAAASASICAVSAASESKRCSSRNLARKRTEINWPYKSPAKSNRCTSSL